jgi:hypothetical protein
MSRVPFEEVLREFISLIHDPLLAQMVAVLNAILNLDDVNSDLLHEALLQHPCYFDIQEQEVLW